jgi:transposase
VAAAQGRLSALKAQAAVGLIDLLFVDESGVLTHPYLARCWARRGTDLRIQASGQRQKIALLGAWDPVRHHLLVHTSLTKRSDDVITLLDRIAVAYAAEHRTRPLVLVMDNGSIQTSKKTTKALAERSWLTVEWLPKYAPELNDIERCWLDLKQHYLANKTFTDKEHLMTTVNQEIARFNSERQGPMSPSFGQAA